MYPLTFGLETRLREQLADHRVSKNSVPYAWSAFPCSWAVYSADGTGDPVGVFRDEDPLTICLDKFYLFYRYLADRVAESYGLNTASPFWMSVYIQPDLINQSSVLVVQRDIDRIIGLFEHRIRHFKFETPSALEHHLKDDWELLAAKVVTKSDRCQ
ncbi:hypothetical protein Dehly_0467 [Dehalogenimonas lykanthroporepellens BL-DC-9]|nr:hypothetical protein Dehly_0467 [Dehalogenimonas lykanthroporepellens BL-DC-9]